MVLVPLSLRWGWSSDVSAALRAAGDVPHSFSCSTQHPRRPRYCVSLNFDPCMHAAQSQTCSKRAAALLFLAFLCPITLSAGERWEEIWRKLRQELHKLHVQHATQTFCSVSSCLLFEWQYTQFGPLYLCLAKTHTQTPLPSARQHRRTHTHTDEAESPSSACSKALGAACLPFTVTAAHVCVFVCVCVSI